MAGGSVLRSGGIPGGVRYADLFRGLPAATRHAFERLEAKSTYPQGAQLFAPDQLGSGIFILRTGSVKVAYPFQSANPGPGIVASPGQVLGLAATVSGAPYDSAAETLEPSQVGFISRRSLLSFLRDNSAVAYRLVEILSDALSETLDQRRWLLHKDDVRH